MAGRHVRSVVGVLWMLLGTAAVMGSRWFYRAADECALTHPVALSWVYVVNRFAFPSLLFVSGLALFSRAAFSDVLHGTRNLFHRRAKP